MALKHTHSPRKLPYLTQRQTLLQPSQMSWHTFCRWVCIGRAYCRYRYPKKETPGCLDMFVPAHQTTWHHIPQGCKMVSHCSASHSEMCSEREIVVSGYDSRLFQSIPSPAADLICSQTETLLKKKPRECNTRPPLVAWSPCDGCRYLWWPSVS
jgi:hypothetical protein